MFPEKTELVTPWVEVTLPAAIVLVRTALSAAFGVPVTTDPVTVQEPLAGTVAPDSCTDVPPATPLTVPPAHVVARLGGVLSTRLAGNVSVNATLVSGTPFELDRVIV